MAFMKQNLDRLSAENFIDTFQNNEYYLFMSSVGATASNNSVASSNEFTDKVLFGKKVDPEEIFYMILNNIWESGRVYQKANYSEDLTSGSHYVTVYPEEETIGEYHIFVCIDNNRNSASTVKPTYTPDTPNQIYYTTDGYVWKWRYSLAGETFQKYNTFGYIPVLESNNSIDYSESITQIYVDNPDDNFGYSEVSGIIDAIFTVSGTVRYYLQASSLQPIENFYIGQSIYVTNTSSEIFTIGQYLFDESANQYYVTLSTPDTENMIQLNSAFKILPTIRIVGTGTGASAIPVIENGSIRKIQMVSFGSGYTRAMAEVLNPVSGFITEGAVITGKKALLTVNINTAYNTLQEEFNTATVLIYDENTTIDNNFLPSTNKYTKIGLVINPQFKDILPLRFDNRIKIETTSSTASLSVGETLIQIKDDIITFECKIHEKTANELWLYDYNGPYENYANTDLSFDPTLALRTTTGGIVSIATDLLGDPIIEYSDYIQRTGRIVYINTFGEIERSETLNEKYKILLQF